MEKSFNDLRDYIEEKFNNIKNKYDELKASLSNDTVEKFKEILKEEISKINDKLEGKIDELCQDISFLQEKISELKKTEQGHCSFLWKNRAVQSKTLFENKRSTIRRQRKFQ